MFKARIPLRDHVYVPFISTHRVFLLLSIMILGCADSIPSPPPADLGVDQFVDCVPNCEPKVVVEKQILPCRLAADESGLYWTTKPYTDFTGGISHWNAKDGVQLLAEENTEIPLAIALDDGFVYWTTSGKNGAIKRVPKNGGAVEILARDSSGEGNKPRALAFDAQNVYWVDFSTGELVAWNKQSKQMKVLANPLGPSDVVKLDDELLVVAQGWRALLSYGQAGGDPETLAQWKCDKMVGCSGHGVASDSKLFWSLLALDEKKGRIMRYDAQTKEVTEISPRETDPISLAIDGQNLFWISFGTSATGRQDGAVRMLRLGTDEITTVASGLLEPCGVAAFDGFVYWTQRVEGKIMRLRVGR